ncbi:NUDIX hydrolase [Candidatus Protochlamydia phocaeensis]|uniref:NUDIX hydrolase n=1 Tax=Candidatus Protochlamydia phocaeensis TaxID=1414722 RepID=UPI000837B4F6|nr:NUDIX hydrolase [Candidatus Protochlamydia phocaeensis]
MECLIFLTPPSDFKPRVEVASCYCTYQDNILLLRRHPAKSQGHTWGVPAGKLEQGEDSVSAIIREAFEEIGVVLRKEGLEEIITLYIRQQIDFVYHMFHYSFSQQPSIVLELREHDEFKWVTVEEALKMPLMAGEKDTLAFYQKFLKDKPS